MDTAKYSLPKAKDLNYSAELLDFFQNAPIALHWLSGTGHILWANNVELESLGYTAEEYIGHHIMEFCPDEELNLTKVFTNLAKGITVRNEPFKFRTKSGDVRYLIVDSNVSWHADGTFKHTRCFIRDDTERRMRDLGREMELRASKETSAAKSKFIGRLFHEIRTPMHIVDSSLQEVAQTLTLPKNSSAVLSEEVTLQTAKELQSMRQHVDIIMSSLEDVSIATMFEDGKALKITPRMLDLTSIVRDIVGSVGPSEARSGQMVQYSILTGTIPPRVQVDLHIRRILGHLIRNAVRFSPDDARVSISVSHVPVENQPIKGIFSFRISNNVSQPMDLKVINDCFRRFYATTDTASGKSQIGESLSSTLMSNQGIGLGLFVAFQLVESMGGQLSCNCVDDEAVFTFDLELDFTVDLPQSVREPTDGNTASSKKRLYVTEDNATATTNEWVGVAESSAAAKQIIIGSGSSKRIFSSVQDQSVPISVSTLSHTSVTATPPPASDTTRKLRVLVVDDSPICQRVLVRALNNNGFLTDTADNGQIACDKLLVEPCLYDCVLMDLRMPIMDGITATKRCREAFHLNKVPIIVVTADISEESKIEALNAGANDVMGKPAKADDVLETIGRYLAL